MDKINCVSQVRSRRQQKLSSWLTLVQKNVEFFPGRPAEIYHNFRQNDYVAILARCSNGLIPIVRQFRPAVETYTWELPSGLLEKNENCHDACRRELLEEAGVSARSVHYLGKYYADTGRLENYIHAFFARASNPKKNFIVEEGMSIEFVTAKKLKELVLKGQFRQQLHLGVFMLATWKGFRWE